jgi:periplasmic protein TonB
VYVASQRIDEKDQIMATFERNTYPSHGNGRYLATSFALHMILFSAITFLVIQEEIIIAKPLPMNVSVLLVDAAEHCPFKEEPKTAETIKPVVQKQEPVKVAKVTPVAKPIEQKIPIQEKAVETQPIKPVATITPSHQSTPMPIPQNVQSAPSTRSEIPKVAPAAKSVEAPITPAVFNAAYLNNPKPLYPKISKRLGEEGIVLLKVRVLADGTAGSVSLLKSSDFDRLDQSALEAVKQWKFVAAKQGDKNIESWVSVPIAFKLDS